MIFYFKAESEFDEMKRWFITHFMFEGDPKTWVGEFFHTFLGGKSKTPFLDIFYFTEVNGKLYDNRRDTCPTFIMDGDEIIGFEWDMTTTTRLEIYIFQNYLTDVGRGAWVESLPTHATIRTTCPSSLLFISRHVIPRAEHIFHEAFQTPSLLPEDVTILSVRDISLECLTDSTALASFNLCFKNELKQYVFNLTQKLF